MRWPVTMGARPLVVGAHIGTGACRIGFEFVLVLVFRHQYTPPSELHTRSFNPSPSQSKTRTTERPTPPSDPARHKSAPPA